MKRLLPAALIALACHGLIFLLQPLDTTTPPRLKAARRPVNLNLAHFVPAAPVVQKEQPKPTPPEMAPPPEVVPPPKATAPTPKPNPKPPELKPKPKPKPTPRLKPLPKPEPKPEPEPIAPAPAEITPAVAETPPPKDSDTTQAATEAAAIADPGPVQEAPLVAATPLYDHKPLPRYPRSAMRRGHQGTVLLSVHVTSAGRVGDLSVRTSSGHTALDKAALAAVRTWRFAPGRRGDTPIAMWVEVPIEFNLQ